MEERNRMQSRVRALLAKAESTDYPEEAAIYTAKAQDLITRYAIDMALLETREGKGQIVTRIIEVPAPYPKEKFILLGGVARANNCRAILGLERETIDQMVENGTIGNHKGKLASVVGYESDLDAVEMLFASLLVQAVNEVMAQGPQVSPWGENRTKSFRRSFLYQFAWTVRERLVEASERARTEENDAHQEDLLPVLMSREAAVESAVDERFPHSTTLRTSVTNIDGVLAGDAAGQRADIGSTRLGGRRAIDV